MNQAWVSHRVTIPFTPTGLVRFMNPLKHELIAFEHRSPQWRKRPGLLGVSANHQLSTKKFLDTLRFFCCRFLASLLAVAPFLAVISSFVTASLSDLAVFIPSSPLSLGSLAPLDILDGSLRANGNQRRFYGCGLQGLGVTSVGATNEG